jgi:copper chaperone
MKTEKIIIENLKCGGCEATIKKSLQKLEGVTKVTVDQDTDTVTVVHNANCERTDLLDKLKSLGYPEINSDNTLIDKVKSYASCAVGRISKHNVEQ